MEVPVGDHMALALTGRALPAEDRRVLAAFAAQSAVVLDRRRLQEEADQARALAEGNRIRTALLAAVSHDLRTPLAGIKAAVSSLRSDDVEWSEEDEAELLAAIEEGADRLDHLVGNLLDISRLQTGTVTADRPRGRPRRGGADGARRGPGRRRGAGHPGDPAHGRRRQGPAGAGRSPTSSRTPSSTARTANPSSCRRAPSRTGWRSGSWTAGPGVPDEAKERIFEPFQRFGDAPRGAGVGLGLAVARGFAEALGGTLTAEDTPGGGLTMVLSLRPAPARRSGEPEMSAGVVS
ncbi:Sensor protein KdpD [Streptomyces aurantiogriseus]